MLVSSGKSVKYSELLNPSILNDLPALKERFRTAAPFPHMVFDGLFSPQLLELVADDFALVGEAQLKKRQSEHEVTYRSRTDVDLPASAQVYFDLVNSKRFVQMLMELTGITGLITDALLKNGGLHESRQGGKFDVHLDFSKHPITELDNRLVLITYLNRDWKESYGGCLELWDAAKGTCEAKVVPEFGRSILFEQSSVSLHGHPHPIQTPDGRVRRSLATYYYTNGLKDDETASRFQTHFVGDVSRKGSGNARSLAKYILPPAVIDGFKWIRRSVDRH